MPINKMKEWLQQERALGSTNPDRVVLATASELGIPHSRIVAIREISLQGILFFTQRGTRKVIELTENPYASMTLWLPLQQREVIIDGKIQALTYEENQHYWNQMPRDRQLRFRVYAPISGQAIDSLYNLDIQLKELTEKLECHDIEMSEYYCGFRLVPETFCFYTLGDNAFSDVNRYTKHRDDWEMQLISP